VGSILGIDAEDAMKKYAKGCPKCGKTPCGCKERIRDSWIVDRVRDKKNVREKKKGDKK
jgi:hypothetical protein